MNPPRLMKLSFDVPRRVVGNLLGFDVPQSAFISTFPARRCAFLVYVCTKGGSIKLACTVKPASVHILIGKTARDLPPPDFDCDYTLWSRAHDDPVPRLDNYIVNDVGNSVLLEDVRVSWALEDTRRTRQRLPDIDLGKVVLTDDVEWALHKMVLCLPPHCVRPEPRVLEFRASSKPLQLPPSENGWLALKADRTIVCMELASDWRDVFREDALYGTMRTLDDETTHVYDTSKLRHLATIKDVRLFVWALGTGIRWDVGGNDRFNRRIETIFCEWLGTTKGVLCCDTD